MSVVVLELSHVVKRLIKKATVVAFDGWNILIELERMHCLHY